MDVGGDLMNMKNSHSGKYPKGDMFSNVKRVINKVYYYYARRTLSRVSNKLGLVCFTSKQDENNCRVNCRATFSTT